MSKFLRKISSKWQIYRYRFVPWVAWNLKERTVRSVQDASQDRIIADDLVEETYKRLFNALEDNLPSPEGGVHKQDELNAESNRLNGSKVNPVTSGDQDGGRKCCHQDNATSKSCNKPKCSQLQKLPFQRTFDTFYWLKDKSSWTFGSERGALCKVDDVREQQQNLVQRLLPFFNSGTKDFFKVLNIGAGCEGDSRTQQVSRNERRGNTHTSNSGSSSCSHYQCCNSTLFLHHPHPHSNCHHSNYQNTNTFTKHIHTPSSVQVSHQRSRSTTSSNDIQNIGDTSEAEEEEEMGDALDAGATIMHQTLGFAIGRRQSQIEGGGIGVNVVKGVVPKGAVVAMYPGTIYYPAEPILFQSIANPFIFRCLDGIHIDGLDKRLSKMIFRSCSQRDRLGPYMFSDLSWLTSCPLNPMAVGQYVNNQHKGVPANVCYQEFDVPLDFPMKLRKYIPNTFFGTLPDVGNSGRSMRTVALVSLREIQCGEELLSSYFTLVY